MSAKEFKLYDKDGNELPLDASLIMPSLQSKDYSEFLEGKRKFTMNFNDLVPIDDVIVTLGNLEVIETEETTTVKGQVIDWRYKNFGEADPEITVTFDYDLLEEE